MRLAALALLALLAPATALCQPFSFAEVERRARELAGRTWQAPRVDLPKTLKDLTYDQHRDIRFRPERALWRADGLHFEVWTSPAAHASWVAARELPQAPPARIASPRAWYHAPPAGEALGIGS